MSEIINLRRQRKAKARCKKEKQAEQNRVLHGRTKAEKQRKKKEDDRAARFIDAHKRSDKQE